MISNGIEDEVVETIPVKPKICNFDFKELFVVKKGKMTPEQGFKEAQPFKYFCPTIEKSCCSFEELSDLFSKVNEGFLDFEENIKKLPYLVELIDKTNEIRIDEFIDRNPDKFHQCFKGENTHKQKRSILLKLITDL